jgi:hypothetical protein
MCLQSTLMRSIASGKLDGFPPKEVLRTVYVEHDIDASEASSAVVDFVVHDPMLEGACCGGHVLSRTSVGLLQTVFACL